MNQKNLDAKQQVVNEFSDAVKAHNSLVIVEYRGISVADVTQLRRELKENDAYMIVYKNSLVSRAVDALDKPDLHQYLTGPNAFVFSKDTIQGPKIINKYSRRNEHLVIKGGLIEGRVVDADQVKVVAKLPGRDGLISMFLSVLQAPIRNFAATVKAVAEAKN